jgi:sortase A
VALPEVLESEAGPEPAAEKQAPAVPEAPRVKAPRAAAAPRPQRTPVRSPALLAAGLALSGIGVLVLGFFVYLYGLSSLSEQRAQSVLYKTFAGQLGQATAPTGATADGAPVAILAIPRLGISDLVVVEGTTARDLSHGPGHLRSSVLPGQAGVSVVFGRVLSYGGPFAHLMRLERGDRITVTTGQGVSTYIVESFGTGATPPPDPTPNRLLLETAAGSLFPNHDTTVEVSADLSSSAQPTPASWPATSGEENALARDSGALVPMVFWAQALVLVLAAGVFAARRWSGRAALLCAPPAAFALVWCVYENLSLLLPNLY